jgi:hypothetical protein
VRSPDRGSALQAVRPITTIATIEVTSGAVLVSMW